MKPGWFEQFISAYYPDYDAAAYKRLLADLRVDASKSVKELSRGTRVKLELALALSHNPDLLLLDEPTSGLDPLVRREILDQLAAVVQNESRTVVFSTHITEDVERIADYIVFVVNGTIALMEARETLRDNWQELLVDAADVSHLPGVVRVKNADQPIVQVVLSNSGVALEHLRKSGRTPLQQRPLALDEILGELVAAPGKVA
jgi:ABC-2 type transport system ATP-binding protein